MLPGIGWCGAGLPPFPTACWWLAHPEAITGVSVSAGWGSPGGCGGPSVPLLCNRRVQSPWCKVVSKLCIFLRQTDVRLMVCLDDWLIHATPADLSHKHSLAVLDLYRKLSFHLGPSNPKLSPAQQFTFPFQTSRPQGSATVFASPNFSIVPMLPPVFWPPFLVPWSLWLRWFPGPPPQKRSPESLSRQLVSYSPDLGRARPLGSYKRWFTGWTCHGCLRDYRSLPSPPPPSLTMNSSRMHRIEVGALTCPPPPPKHTHTPSTLSGRIPSFSCAKCICQSRSNLSVSPMYGTCNELHVINLFRNRKHCFDCVVPPPPLFFFFFFVFCFYFEAQPHLTATLGIRLQPQFQAAGIDVEGISNGTLFTDTSPWYITVPVVRFGLTKFKHS